MNKKSFLSLLFLLILFSAYNFSSCKTDEELSDKDKKIQEMADLFEEIEEAAKEGKDIENKYTSTEEAVEVPKEERLEEGTLTLIFEDYGEGDLEHYTFSTEAGTEYDFQQILEYKYPFATYSDESGEGIGNPELTGKKFKVTFHSQSFINTYDGDSEDIMYIIDKIEMIEE